MKQTVANDFVAAARAKRHGMHHAVKIAQEARKAGVPYDLAYALVEKETTNGRNVFGHDPTASIPRAWMGGRVTKKRYLAYRAARRAGRGMQGVGLTQLTWWEFQDQADRLGGCWKPRIQCRVAFERLRALIRAFGLRDGVRRYNGSGDAAERYARDVLAKRAAWRRRLNP